MLFTTDCLHVPASLSITDTMFIVKKGAKNYFQTLVTIASSTYITIKENDFIGKLQLVSSIVNLSFKQLKSTYGENSFKSKHTESTYQTDTNKDSAQKNHVDQKERQLINTED